MILAVKMVPINVVEDDFAFSKRVHANQDNYFHMSSSSLGSDPVCIPEYFANDEYNWLRFWNKWINKIEF